MVVVKDCLESVLEESGLVEIFLIKDVPIVRVLDCGIEYLVVGLFLEDDLFQDVLGRRYS